MGDGNVSDDSLKSSVRRNVFSMTVSITAKYKHVRFVTYAGCNR